MEEALEGGLRPLQGETMRPLRVLPLLLLLGLSGCLSLSSRLQGLKERYDRGRWEEVLCRLPSRTYCADEVAARAGGEPLVADQARIIGARARIHLARERGLWGSSEGNEEVRKALVSLSLVGDLAGAPPWMEREIRLGRADMLALSADPAAGWEVYNQVLSESPAEGEEGALERVIPFWYGAMKATLGLNYPPRYRESLEKGFNKTLGLLEKRWPRNPYVRMARIFSLAEERPLEALTLWEEMEYRHPSFAEWWRQERDSLLALIFSRTEGNEEMKAFLEERRRISEAFLKEER